MQSNTVSVQTATVIKFPRINTQSTTSCEEMTNRLIKMKLQNIDDAMAFLIPPLFEGFFSIGFSIRDDRKAQIVIECLRAMMYDHHDFHHEITDFIDKHQDEISDTFHDDNEELLEEAFT